MLENNQLSSKIIFAGKQQEAIIREFLKGTHLEFIHIEILEYLKLHPGIAQKELTDHFNKSLYHQLVLLEKYQLIFRKPFINDIRQKRVCLTDKGEKILGEFQSCYDQNEQRIQWSLTLEEQTTLTNLLDKVQKGLEA